MSVSGTVTGSTYHIAKGDTLSEIAQQFGTTVEALARANNISNPDLIYAGADLQLTTGGGAGQSGGVSGGGNIQPGNGTGNFLSIASKYIGQHEYANGNNPFIVACHGSTTLGRAADEVPWCSSFVNRVVEEAGYKGTDSAAAISWAKWGTDVGSLANARPGDIVVVRGPHGNHVGFLARSGNGTITLLGGNQSDQVKESTFSLGSYDILITPTSPPRSADAFPYKEKLAKRGGMHGA